MSRNIITGIDAGSSFIRMIAAEQKKDGSLHILAASQKPSEGVKRGFVTDIDDAVKSINNGVKAIEKITGMPCKKAVISVGGIGLSSARSKGMVIVSKADTEITEHDIKRVISQSEENLNNTPNKRIIHTFPLSFKIDGNPVLGRPVGMKGAKLEVETFFITCIDQHLKDLIKVVESAGISVDDVVAAPLAMSYAVLTKYQKEAGCVLVNIGFNTVSIIVFEEGLPISLEVFPIGSIHITHDIALGMQISLDDAEKLKLNYGVDSSSLSKKRISDIIDARLNDIFDLIKIHLKKINRNEMLPAGIIMTGGGSNLFSLEEVAKSYLKLPSKIGVFSMKGNGSLKNISATSNSLKEQILNDPGWSTALGLCLINSSEDSGSHTESGEIKKTLGQGLRKIFSSFLP